MELIPQILFALAAIQVVRKILETQTRLPEWDWLLSKVWVGSVVLFVVAQISFFSFLGDWYNELIYLILLTTVWLLRDYRPAHLFSLALLPYAVVYALGVLLRLLPSAVFESVGGLFKTAQSFTFLWLIGFGIYATVQSDKERKQKKKEEAERKIVEARKAELEHLVVERTAELTQQKDALEQTLEELKAAQAQLVQAEKMASLGELTAGIAHEIQNPLNFVNNFAEMSVELAQELREELEKPQIDTGLVTELLQDLVQNQQKINHHGKRASSIVSGMLQHARTGADKKEPVDLNALAEEYLRLSYHGLRAKDKSFNAKMITDFDPAIGKVEVVQQDMGRVFLNLINNAFYAVHQRERQLAAAATPELPGSPGDLPSLGDLPGFSNLAGLNAELYEPTVTIRTKKLENTIEIRIKDNGIGIPDAIKAKIFQPFFTTKPTGQGTGLGLSLAYDIVTKGHDGTLEVESAEGEGTEFIVRLGAVS